MILDIIVILLIGFLTWRGFKRGLIGSLISMFAFIISIIITWFAYPYISRTFGGNALVNMGIVLALFILCMIGLRFVARLLKVITNLPIIKQVNALGGGVFGFLRGALIVYGVLALIAITRPVGIHLATEQYSVLDNMFETSSVASAMYENNLITNFFEGR